MFRESPIVVGVVVRDLAPRVGVAMTGRPVVVQNDSRRASPKVRVVDRARPSRYGINRKW